MTLQTRIQATAQNLTGLTYHPAGKGRVIILDPPYALPEGMDLRGIAGVVLKREQNPETAAAIRAMSDEDYRGLFKHEGRYDGTSLKQLYQRGPRPPAPFALPAFIMDEVRELSAAFTRLTGTNETGIHFPANRAAPQFHIDGMSNRPAWRLTYAFTGAQTIWHSAERKDSTHVASFGTIGFPILPDDEAGAENIDYFKSEGALMFLTNSANGLFHKVPPEEPGRRFIATFDTYAPKRADCSRSCPFPCR